MHTLVVYLELLQDCEEIQYQPVLANERFREILFQQIRHTVSNEPEEWFTSYVSKPSNFSLQESSCLGSLVKNYVKRSPRNFKIPTRRWIICHSMAMGNGLPRVFHK